MKIAVIGSHRVGKTTLVEDLSKALPDYHTTLEPYWELVENGHDFPPVPDFDDFMVQLDYSLNQINEAPENIILDRSPIDIMAYLQSSPGYDGNRIQDYYDEVIQAVRAIDLYIYVPIEEPDCVVCLDSEMPELREQVDTLLPDLIDEFNIQPLQVYGTPGERLQQVLLHLKRTS